MSGPCPRIVIGGTHSGVGKTSLTLALVAALRRRGHRVQTFKVGPDFLDPSYLTIASGRACYNLDGWMMGRKHVEGLFARATADADIAVIEGVMGLFDGTGPDSLEGSTAEIAAWLKAPVVLAADVYGMARSFAAMVKGYATFDRTVRIGGVIANLCGSERHGKLLEEALSAASLPPLVAAVPRGGLPGLPSRHLGLVTADSRNLSPQKLEELADMFEARSSLQEIVKLAEAAPPLNLKVPPRKRLLPRARIGIAFDGAFHFYYRDLLDELEDLGCELAAFSPAADKGLPACLDALYFGGGYPEELARELSGNTAMIADIIRFARSGRPVYAECGGLMYLCRSLETTDGEVYPMVGLLPAETRMHKSLRALSYTEVELQEDSLWGEKGSVARGHEFHYSELLSSPAGAEGWRPAYIMRKRRGTPPEEEGFQRGKVLASYAHMHLASRPELLEYFIKTCEGQS